MPTATLTSKGQITLPARIRERLRLVPGSKVDFEEQPNGDFVVRRKTADLAELYGFFQAPPGLIASREDIDKAIGDEMAEKLARCR